VDQAYGAYSCRYPIGSEVMDFYGFDTSSLRQCVTRKQKVAVPFRNSANEFLQNPIERQIKLFDGPLELGTRLVTKVKLCALRLARHLAA
jgi:hypothetical protein